MLGLGVQGLAFGVWGSFGIWGFRGLGFRVYGAY